jgi:O-antigen ligase
MVRILGFLALVSGLFAVVYTGRMRIPHDALIVLGLLLMLALASVFWAVDAEENSRSIRAYLQVTWVVWLIWEFGSTLRQQTQLMAAYVSGAYALAVSTLHNVGAMTITAHAAEARYSPEGFNPNWVAVSLALAIPFAAYLASDQRTTWRLRWLWYGYILVGPIAILLTGSRGGFVAGTFAVLAVPLLTIRHKLRALVAIVLVSTLLVSVSAVFIPDQVWNRLSTIPQEVLRGDMNGRTSIWSYGERILEEHPLFGVGAGGYLQAAGIAYTAHNTFLSTAAELGLLGLLLFCTILFVVWHCILKSGGIGRRLWIPLLLCWTAGACVGVWELRRPTWIVLGLALAHCIALRESSASELLQIASYNERPVHPGNQR